MAGGRNPRKARPSPKNRRTVRFSTAILAPGTKYIRRFRRCTRGSDPRPAQRPQRRGRPVKLEISRPQIPEIAQSLCVSTRQRHAQSGSSGGGMTRVLDRPLFRSSIILTALPGKSSNSPAHTHRRCLPAVLRTFNTHNKCTGVCRFVRGIPVGIGRRVAELWGFCGARRSP
jgi:hypothetical protein